MTHPIKNIIHQFESQSVSGLDKPKNLNKILNQLNVTAKKTNKRMWFFPALVVLLCTTCFMLGYWLGQIQSMESPVKNIPIQKERQHFQKPKVEIKDTVFVIRKHTTKPVIKNESNVYPDIHSNDAELQKNISPSDVSFLIQKTNHSTEKDSVIQVAHSDIEQQSKGSRTNKPYASPVFMADTVKAKEVSLKWKHSSGGLMHSSSIKRQ